VSPVEVGAILLAGLAAGALNTVVGSGSLITFPTLLAFGYPALVANVSNTLGLLPGSLSGVVGYRRELVGQGDRALRLGVAAALGGLTGGMLLIALPASAFSRIVPLLILAACGLVALQPRLSRVLAAGQAADTTHWPLLATMVYLTAIYGGYFGAAQSVILIALLGIFLADDLQRLNGLKNLLACAVNAAAAVLFVAAAPVSWVPAGLLAVGSIVGGQVGARYGRRLPPRLLRALIVVVGTVVAVRLLIAG
jgi:uncharacterized protein